MVISVVALRLNERSVRSSPSLLTKLGMFNPRMKLILSRLNEAVRGWRHLQDTASLDRNNNVLIVYSKL